MDTGSVLQLPQSQQTNICHRRKGPRSCPGHRAEDTGSQPRGGAPGRRVNRFLKARTWGFIRELALSNYRSPRLPYRLLVYLTLRCNCRCQICNVWKKQSQAELGREELERIFRFAAPFLRWLHLGGGEIFLRDDFPNLLGSIGRDLDKLFLLQFATNATLPDRVMQGCGVLADGPVPQIIVTISIDGIGADHDRQRGVDGLFERAISLYRDIKSAYRGRISVCLGLTVTRSNCRDLADTFGCLHRDYKIPYTDLHVNFYHQSDVFYCNLPGETLSPEQAREGVRIISSAMPWYYRLTPSGFFEHRYRQLFPLFLERRRSPLLCGSFSSSLTLSPEGECCPCTLDRRSAGNIRDFDYRIDRLWNSSARKMIRESIKGGDCPQCWTPCEAFQAMFAHSLPGHRKWLPGHRTSN